MSTAKLRPFKLEEFVDNEKTPVCYENGEQLEVFVRKQCETIYPVIACTRGDFDVITYTNDGRDLEDSSVSLFFAKRKKVVPLNLMDIKPGMAFKIFSRCEIAFPTSAGLDGVAIAAIGVVSYADLQHNYCYSFDCLTWHRCEKEVEA